MKLLRAMEYVAVGLILVGLIGGLGKSLVDYACSLSPSQATYSVTVFPPSQMEKEIYLAGLKRQVSAMEIRMMSEARK